MIPTELITLLGSSVLASLFKIWSFSMRARHFERQSTLFAFKQQFSAQSKAINQARSYENTGFQWTRRSIALMAAFFIIVFPKLAAVFWPEVNIHIGYPQISQGFLFFSSDVEKIKWMQLKGLAITPLDTHLLSSIIGLYFGSSIIGSK